jgi:hypothetical protein
MAEKFTTYRSFNDKVLAAELYQKLSEAGIPVAWEDTVGYFDASFSSGDNILNIFYVKLRQQDFKTADELLMNAVAENIQEPISDYYLFSFSNDELIDVLKKPDEWNEFDLYWAKKILTTRGIVVKQEDVEKAREERLSESKKPWSLDKVWVFFAFALLLFAFVYLHFLTTFMTIFIGIYIVFSKKTLRDGQKVKAFSPTDRLLGKIVLAGGILVVLCMILYLMGFTGYEWFFLSFYSGQTDTYVSSFLFVA